jgi:hypothetical protein
MVRGAAGGCGVSDPAKSEDGLASGAAGGLRHFDLAAFKAGWRAICADRGIDAAEGVRYDYRAELAAIRRARGRKTSFDLFRCVDAVEA